LNCNLGYQKAQQQREINVVKIALAALTFMILVLSISNVYFGFIKTVEIPDLSGPEGTQVMINTDPEPERVAPKPK